MSESAVERAQALFQQYRRRASTASSPGGDSVSAEASVTTPSTLTRQASASGPDSLRMPRMTQKDLKLLLQDVDNELFEFVWGLFDVSGDGVVYADDFVAAMALLSSCADVSVSIEEQMKACFVMFDTRNDGRLGYAHARALTHTPHFIRSHISPLTRFRLPLSCSYSEFRSMLEATVTLNLKRMLLTEAGLHHVEKHMEQEFSKENLTFWQAVRGYRDAEDRYSAAKVIMDHYVRPGSEEEVNLPSGIRETLVKTFDESDAAASSGQGQPAPPPESLFEAAEEEIFKLMERDAFARFKSNPEAVAAVVDEFFATADISQDGYVSFDEYRKWVMKQPQVIVFFSQLAQSILAILKSASTSPGAEQLLDEISVRNSNAIVVELPPAAEQPA